MLLWGWPRAVIRSLVHMVMVRMPVGLLALLAGRRPLLARCRAAVLSEGGHRGRQDDADETHTKKCTNQASLRCHTRPLLTHRPNAVPGVRRRDKRVSLRPNVCELPLRPIKEFEERTGVEKIELMPQKLLAL